ncbi:MAG: hypothetical protein OXK76_01855 [Gammaproteobacteria bacterium]|nr:hypothetical protein [Gammaproteobacteria bacterium]
MNRRLDRWSAETRPTIELLRSFRMEAWATIPIVASWLALSGLDRTVAASNAVLLCVVGAIACLVGGRLGALRGWPATALVPRYGQSLFLLCLATAGSATAFGVLWSWWLGNPFPAIGPVLLVALATTLGAMGISSIQVVVFVLPLAVVLATWVGLATVLSPGLSLPGSGLADVRIQLGALAGSWLLALRTKRALTQPAAPKRQAQPTIGTWPAEDLRTGAVVLAGTLCVIVPLWYWIPSAFEFVFVLAWWNSLVNMLLSSFFTAHIHISRDRLLGIAAHRKHLGHRFGVRLAWISVVWLVLGTAIAAIHAFAKSAEDGFLFDEVLAIQSITVASFAVLCRATRRLPPSARDRFLIGVPWMALTGGACFPLALLDYSAWAQAVLVIAVIGAGALAMGFGGPALARVEVLSEEPVSLGLSGRGP